MGDGKFLLFSSFLYLLVSQSLAISCYDCVEADQASCQRGKGLQFTECFEPLMYDKRLNGSRASCTKVVGKVKDIERTFRACGISNGPEDSCKTVARKFPDFSCYQCDGDLCNTAAFLYVKWWIIAMITFLMSLNFN